MTRTFPSVGGIKSSRGKREMGCPLALTRRKPTGWSTEHKSLGQIVSRQRRVEEGGPRYEHGGERPGQDTTAAAATTARRPQREFVERRTCTIVSLVKRKVMKATTPMAIYPRRWTEVRGGLGAGIISEEGSERRRGSSPCRSVPRSGTFNREQCDPRGHFTLCQALRSRDRSEGRTRGRDACR